MDNLEKACIVVLDDDRNILDSLDLLLSEKYSNIILTDNPNSLIELLSKQDVDLLLMDMNYRVGEIDGQDGLNLLKRVKLHDPDLPVIIMTAYGEVDLVVESMKIGVLDFIQKPWSNQRFLTTISNAIRMKNQAAEVKSLKGKERFYLNNQVANEFGMIGSSNAMKMLKDKIKRIANADANVLILGENGTGKELVAKAIHQLSFRKDNSFIKIDLGSVHEQLFESELFGSKKGAFTGATEEKIGRIAMSDQGTLFLDEIGNLSLSMQSKILSVLQNREVIPVGGTKAVKVDARIISATNLSIHDLLDDDNFRQDLLYRVNTVEIQIPPLRERKEDIQELLFYFKDLYQKKYQIEELEFDERTIQASFEYHWPGNIRELQHAVERAVLLAENKVIKITDLILVRKRSPSKREIDEDLNLERLEERAIKQALKNESGNISNAAKILGLTRAALYRRLDKYEL